MCVAAVSVGHKISPRHNVTKRRWNIESGVCPGGRPRARQADARLTSAFAAARFRKQHSGRPPHSSGWFFAICRPNSLRIRAFSGARGRFTTSNVNLTAAWSCCRLRALLVWPGQACAWFRSPGTRQSDGEHTITILDRLPIAVDLACVAITTPLRMAASLYTKISTNGAIGPVAISHLFLPTIGPTM